MRERLAQLYTRMGPLWWYSALMFGFTRIGDLVNLYIALFLVPDVLAQDQLGAIIPINKLVVVMAVPLSIILATSLKYVSVFIHQGQPGKVKAMLRDLSKIMILLSLVVTTVLILFRSFFEVRLKIEDPRIIWLIVAMCLMAIWGPAVSMVAQGLKKFYSIIITRVTAPIVRLIVILIFLQSMQLSGYLLATVLASLSVMLLLASRLLPYLKPSLPCVSYKEHWPEMRRYLVPVGLIILFTALQSMVEPWIIRQRLSPADSAGFYMAISIGNIPMYLSNAMVPFFFTLVSDHFEKGEPTRRLHLQALSFVLLVGGGMSIGFLLFGDALLQLREGWIPFRPYAKYIGLLGLVTTCDMLILVHYLHQNACHRFGYLKYIGALIMLELVVLYGLNGWGLLVDILPPELWEFVRVNVLRSLAFTVGWMLLIRLLIVLGIGIELMRNKTNEPARP
jgi:O-antigen/teichoic acid export membrane protein